MSLHNFQKIDFPSCIIFHLFGNEWKSFSTSCNIISFTYISVVSFTTEALARIPFSLKYYSSIPIQKLVLIRNPLSVHEERPRILFNKHCLIRLGNTWGCDLPKPDKYQIWVPSAEYSSDHQQHIISRASGFWLAPQLKWANATSSSVE